MTQFDSLLATARPEGVNCVCVLPILSRRKDAAGPGKQNDC